MKYRLRIIKFVKPTGRLLLTEQVLEMNMKLTDSISLSVVKEAQPLSETQCAIIPETDIMVSGKNVKLLSE